MRKSLDVKVCLFWEGGIGLSEIRGVQDQPIYSRLPIVESIPTTFFWLFFVFFLIQSIRRTGNPSVGALLSRINCDSDSNSKSLEQAHILVSSAMPFRKQKQAPPVVYDEAAHREFVTGFRKRKEARRQHAAASATAAGKEARRQERRAKREVFRSKIIENDDDFEDAENGEEFTYCGEGDVIVKTSVTSLEGGLDRVGANMEQSEGVHGNKTGKSVDIKGGKEQKKGNNTISKNEKGATLGAVKSVQRVGVRKVRKSSYKRRVSYTHLLSKGNKRRAQLRRRAERK